MDLQLFNGLPDDNLLLSFSVVAPMRKFTKINEILNNLIYFSKKWTFNITVRAANCWLLGILLWRILLFFQFLLLDLLFKLWVAVLAEKLVTVFALHWLVWELEAYRTLDLFNHLALQFILNLIYLDVKRWDWVWTHDVLDGLVGDNKIHALIEGEVFFFWIHFLEYWVWSLFRLTWLLAWHLYILYFIKIICWINLF